MSRSLGESVAGSIGVISVPDVLECELGSLDKIVVIGSDGLFEFLSNENVIRIASNFWKKNDCENACLSLVRAADERWRSEEDSIDDITCICLYLDF